MSSGKWYWESTFVSNTSSSLGAIGIVQGSTVTNNPFATGVGKALWGVAEQQPFIGEAAQTTTDFKEATTLETFENTLVSELTDAKNRKTLSRLQQTQNRIKKILKENERKIKNFKEQTFL
jgi:hypothetical protein